jgi:hypothetical protein
MSAIVTSIQDAKDFLEECLKRKTESALPHQIEQELLALDLLTVNARARLLRALGDKHKGPQ